MDEHSGNDFWLMYVNHILSSLARNKDFKTDFKLQNSFKRCEDPRISKFPSIMSDHLPIRVIIYSPQTIERVLKQFGIENSRMFHTSPVYV